MPKLVIHAPHYRTVASRKDFATIFRSGLATGYAINRLLHPKVKSGMKVILLRKDKGKARAEGVLSAISASILPTANGVLRYDLEIADFQQVNYRSESLNRNGVNVT